MPAHSNIFQSTPDFPGKVLLIMVIPGLHGPYIL